MVLNLNESFQNIKNNPGKSIMLLLSVFLIETILSVDNSLALSSYINKTTLSDKEKHKASV